jgi:hypothetical protein
MSENKKNESFNVAWVEVGRPIGKYARNNMRIMGKMFPNLKQYLISDSTMAINSATVIDTRYVPHSNRTKEFLAKEKTWPHRQQYFWLGTTSRFFHLYDAMKFYGLENVLHLETDSVLLDETPIRGFFQVENDYDLAYPLQASGIGCASILLVKNHEGLSKFLDFVLANWTRNGVDDMSLLGEFSMRKEVRVLPTWPDKTEGDYFYDAQSVGKYYLGTDARNCRLPFSKRGIIDQRQGAIFPMLLNSENIWRIRHNYSQPSIQLKNGSHFYSLVNIHIHSKHIPKHPRALTFFLNLGFGPRIPLVWRIGLFDRNVFAERLMSFISRRLLRRRNFQERIFR